MTNLVLETTEQLLAFLKSELISSSNLSIRGVARLCSVNDRSIISGADFHSSKLAAILTDQGFKSADLAKTGFPPKAVWLTIEYFAYESKAKALGAKQIARTFGSIGILTTFERLQEQNKITKDRAIVTKHSFVEYAQAYQYVETINDLNIRQLLRDGLEDEMTVIRGQKLLTSKPKQYTIAKVRAKELGYSQQEIGNGAQLGKFLKNNVTVAYSERVGKYPVNHYEVNDKLDTAIKNFFGMRRAIA